MDVFLGQQVMIKKCLLRVTAGAVLDGTCQRWLFTDLMEG